MMMWTAILFVACSEEIAVGLEEQSRAWVMTGITEVHNRSEESMAFGLGLGQS